MSWQEQLRAELTGTEKLAILGIGSILCGDDAAGMLLVERLEQILPKDGRTLLMGGSTAPENFIGVIKNYAPDTLVVVDAAYIGGELGEIGFIDRANIEAAGFSTHMLPFPVLLDYLEKETHCNIIILGIQPGETEFATDPCETVLASVEELTAFFVSLR